MTASAPPPRRPLTLRNVTIVDTGDGALAPGLDVRIADGVIAAITPTDPAADTAATTGDAEVVDGSGQYLIPGFLDMHAHPLNERHPAGGLELMLANGITGFRQMAGSPQMLTQRAAGTLPLPADSPAVLALPGSLLTPLNAGTIPAAVAAVGQQAAEGADFIKIALITPDVFFPAMAEARRLGLPVAGHLPAGIDVSRASRAGIRAIEHLGPGLTIIAGCSTDEVSLAEAIAGLPKLRLPSVKLPFMERILMRVLRTVVINPVNRSTPAEIEILQQAVDTFSEERAAELAGQFAEDGTWQVPTLIRLRTQYLCDAPEFSDDPDLRYMAGPTVRSWQSARGTFEKKFPPPSRATFRAAYDVLLRMTKIFNDGGVRMLAGSDAVGAAWEVPGPSLHREFDELARAGLPPLRILQLTTRDAAEFLGASDTLGSVGVGKRADLVLLGANPVADAAALHQVTGVVRAGRAYSATDLAALKDRVRTAHPAT
ncbi:MAG TPA: amidohydrolase family protein [Trebonia sp.]|nr:amidohydrolase family protein [Trebonia sp.]